MPKINPADAEEALYLEAQMKRAPRTKAADILMLALLFSLIFTVGLLIWLLPQKDFSENENRALTTYEELTAKDLTAKDLTAKLADICTDQFPARDALVGFKAYLSLALLKYENNGVVFGSNGTLVTRLEYSEKQTEYVKDNLDAVRLFSSALESGGAEVTFAVAPRTCDILASRLPPLYSPERSAAAWSLFDGTEFVDFRETLKSSDDTMYRTDHHWTAQGAYLAYLRLADSLGYTALPEADFDITAAADFLGTTYSKSGFYLTSPDTVYYYRYEGDDAYRVVNAETESPVLFGLYDASKLETKDKYASYLGGNYAHITISDGSAKPRLLVVKDSYFNALAPFLALHFELDVIDLRFYSDSVAKYASETAADRILILCGIDSLASDDTYTLLKYGLH